MQLSQIRIPRIRGFTGFLFDELSRWALKIVVGVRQGAGGKRVSALFTFLHIPLNFSVYLLITSFKNQLHHHLYNIQKFSYPQNQTPEKILIQTNFFPKKHLTKYQY